MSRALPNFQKQCIVCVMLKVLVVEDEEFIRRGFVYTTDWLKMNCAVCAEASDGEEGLAKILELKPDIVITDIKMPGMTGLQMIEAAEKQGAQFCSIILSSYSDFEYAKTSIKLGVLEYILKPVDETELAQAISRARNVIEKKQTSDKSTQNLLKLPEFPLASENYYVNETVKYIQKEYKTKLTIEALAGHLDVSVSYLSRKIKQVTNQTFLELLNSYRIIKASELLKTGRYRVYEVSEMAGFSDCKYFCTVFKKYTGFSPSALVN